MLFICFLFSISVIFIIIPVGQFNLVTFPLLIYKLTWVVNVVTQWIKLLYAKYMRYGVYNFF